MFHSLTDGGSTGSGSKNRMKKAGKKAKRFTRRASFRSVVLNAKQYSRKHAEVAYVKKIALMKHGGGYLWCIFDLFISCLNAMTGVIQTNAVCFRIGLIVRYDQVFTKTPTFGSGAHSGVHDTTVENR